MKHQKSFLFGAALVAAILAGRGGASTSLEVLYLANEGVLIRSGEQSVLIDGLFRPYRNYAHLPPQRSQALEAAHEPFDGADLILVSHIHGDHFHPQSASNYLYSQADSILASSEQAVAAVRSVLGRDESIAKRLIEITPEVGKKEKRKFGDIEVTFLGLRHSSQRHRWIQNLGHLIRMGNNYLLHVGDAELSAANYSPFKLTQEQIDVAFLPYWYLISEEGRQLVEELIQPRRVVAVHVLPEEAEEVCASIAKALPDAVCLKELLHTVRF